jgi:hypothetical protein
MGWEQTSGSGGSDKATVHLKKKLQVVIYPGEVPQHDGGATAGHLYVQGLDDGDLCIEIAAGPWPGNSHSEAGGHTAGETKAGTYKLGPKHHHITQNWPQSTIPWGAALQENSDGTVSYTIDGGKPVQVSGKDGVMTKALAKFWDTSTDDQRKAWGNTTRDQFINNTWSLYNSQYEKLFKKLMPSWAGNGNLQPTWYQNDFGMWSWNLQPTAYYIHTTPPDEWAEMLGKPRGLENSHGCIHTHPADRKKLEDVLKTGMTVIVKKYGDVGPNGPPS